nr:MAG TPA: hypothetical protein [Caudoviricetes sp.]
MSSPGNSFTRIASYSLVLASSIWKILNLSTILQI